MSNVMIYWIGYVAGFVTMGVVFYAYRRRMKQLLRGLRSTDGEMKNG